MRALLLALFLFAVAGMLVVTYVLLSQLQSPPPALALVEQVKLLILSVVALVALAGGVCILVEVLVGWLVAQG